MADQPGKPDPTQGALPGPHRVIEAVSWFFRAAALRSGDRHAGTDRQQHCSGDRSHDRGAADGSNLATWPAAGCAGSNNFMVFGDDGAGEGARLSVVWTTLS